MSETYPARARPGWRSVPASSTGTAPPRGAVTSHLADQAFSVSAQLAATSQMSAVAPFIGAPLPAISAASSIPFRVGALTPVGQKRVSNYHQLLTPMEREDHVISDLLIFALGGAFLIGILTWTPYSSSSVS